jgi:hypothetical protein
MCVHELRCDDAVVAGGDASAGSPGCLAVGRRWPRRRRPPRLERPGDHVAPLPRLFQLVAKPADVGKRPALRILTALQQPSPSDRGGAAPGPARPATRAARRDPGAGGGGRSSTTSGSPHPQGNRRSPLPSPSTPLRGSGTSGTARGHTRVAGGDRAVLGDAAERGRSHPVLARRAAAALRAAFALCPALRRMLAEPPPVHVVVATHSGPMRAFSHGRAGLRCRRARQRRGGCRAGEGGRDDRCGCLPRPFARGAPSRRRVAARVDGVSPVPADGSAAEVGTGPPRLHR